MGRHLWLYTDVPASNGVDELPLVFDKAVAEWGKYFGVETRELAKWQMQGFLIRDREKFSALGLMPEMHHDFINGYAQGSEFWLVDQPSDYFRRHLLLHEGTHGFMYAHLGGAGAGWYMEGMAEMLGTHLWKDAQLKLGVMPASKKATPMWGRIKLVRDACQAGKPMSLGDMMSLNAREVFSTEQYAWCWAMCRFLDSHLLLQDRFRELEKYVDDPNFNVRFRRLFQRDWEDLEFEWNVFLQTLDYGYDARRMTMVHSPAETLKGKETLSLAADRGWQSSGWKLKAGEKYRVSAKGRYQIAHRKQPWPCEPGGVTLEYHEGHPLGMLLGLLRVEGENQLPQPVAIGLEEVIQPESDAILYLRVNDSPARLSDNLGTLQVSIEQE